MNKNQNLIKLGKVLNTRGLKGELKVFLDNNQSTSLDIGSIVYIGKNSDIAYKLLKISTSSNKTFIKISEIDSIEKAQELKNQEIFIERDSLGTLDEDEYYLNDLLEFEVYNEFDKRLGKIEKFYSNGAQDIAVISSKENSIDIPLIEGIILNINYEKQTMIIKDLEFI